MMRSVQLFNPNMYEIDVDMADVSLKMDAFLGKRSQVLLGEVSGCDEVETRPKWLTLHPETSTLTCLAVDIDIINLSLVEKLIEQCNVLGHLGIEVHGPVNVRFPLMFHSELTMRLQMRLFTFIEPCVQR